MFWQILESTHQPYRWNLLAKPDHSKLESSLFPNRLGNSDVGLAPTFYFARKRLIEMDKLGIEAKASDMARGIAEEKGLELVDLQLIGSAKNLTQIGRAHV